jgi:hypothetical protein
MPRKRLTLEALVAQGQFDPGNFRHRRALDESGPLSDPELEEQRQHVLDLRGSFGGRVRAAQELRRFAGMVADRPRR